MVMYVCLPPTHEFLNRVEVLVWKFSFFTKPTPWTWNLKYWEIGRKGDWRIWRLEKNILGELKD